MGEARVAAGRQRHIALTLAAARGFEGGRCGGSPPAQGRAEGPTAQKARREWHGLGEAAFLLVWSAFEAVVRELIGGRGRFHYASHSVGLRPRPGGSIMALFHARTMTTWLT